MTQPRGGFPGLLSRVQSDRRRSSEGEGVSPTVGRPVQRPPDGLSSDSWPCGLLWSLVLFPTPASTQHRCPHKRGAVLFSGCCPPRPRAHLTLNQGRAHCCWRIWERNGESRGLGTAEGTGLSPRSGTDSGLLVGMRHGAALVGDGVVVSQEIQQRTAS